MVTNLRLSFQFSTVAVGGQISSNPCLCFSPTAWAAPGLHLQGAPGSEREPAHGQGALGGGGADLQRVHPAQEEQRRPGGTHQTQGVVHGHPLPVRWRHRRCRESETKWVMLLILLLFFPRLTHSGANSSLSSRSFGSVPQEGTCILTLGGITFRWLICF